MGFLNSGKNLYCEMFKKNNRAENQAKQSGWVGNLPREVQRTHTEDGAEEEGHKGVRRLRGPGQHRPHGGAGARFGNRSSRPNHVCVVCERWHPFACVDLCTATFCWKNTTITQESKNNLAPRLRATGGIAGRFVMPLAW